MHPKFKEDDYDGANYKGFANITEDGSWSPDFFVKVNGDGFTVGNNFCSCDHKSCGGNSDTDCEQDLTAVKVTVEKDRSIRNLNNALSALKNYVVENENGWTPFTGCLYNVDTSVCVESINLLLKLGFTGDIPEPPEL